MRQQQYGGKARPILLWTGFLFILWSLSHLFIVAPSFLQHKDISTGDDENSRPSFAFENGDESDGLFSPLTALKRIHYLHRIEAKKRAWGDLLAINPYANRPQHLYSEWKQIPKKDRPDLAFELDFLKTMDPALGAVPHERLLAANKEMDRWWQQRAPIPDVTWEERGPDNVGGRSRALMFDPNDMTHKKVWAGGVGGGLWYTDDITAASPVWNKVNDLWANIAVTTMAFNPANTQEFYVGTGEGWYNQDAQNGTGIWKSTNGGTTWTNLASTIPGAYNSASHFHFIQKIVVKSNGHVFAATRGYFINTGGIMRSTNGGTSWSNVLSVFTGLGELYDRAADLEIAANGDLFASFGIFSEGKVFKSTNADNGAPGTWTDLSSNVVIGNAKRIELACAPSNSSVIYAVAHGGSGTNDVEWFKKSTNGGTTWSSIAIPRLVDDGTTHFTRGQAYYNLILAIHPSSSDVVIAGGIDLHRTINGGTTWTGISHWLGGFSKPYVHADQHGILFRPGASDEVLFSNDGGIFYSTNAGNSSATPSFAAKNSGYNVTQFYSCAAKNAVNSHYFLAGSQDNGSQQFIQPQTGSTTEVTGGDGGFCHIDQLNSTIQLTSNVFNEVYRSLNGGTTFSTLFSQNTGHFINPSEYDSERKILYAASDNNLLKRVTGIDGSINNTDLSVSVGTSKVSALKLSPYNDVLFLGIANGRVYKFSNASTGTPTLSRIDNGATPITATGWVSSIDVGANDDQVLVTYSNYGVISVWETTNGGTTWRNKEGNLPDIPIRWTIYNPENRNQVLAATELGVWSTDNFQPGSSNAPTWGASNIGLAHTRCNMLKYRPSDKLVVVATHGRGLYTSDIFVTTPVADFLVDQDFSCTGTLTANFTDASLKPNGSWAWDMDHNGTTDYTSQNPSHTYSSPGIYSVKLTINNGSTSTTKNNFILVLDSQPTIHTGCSLDANNNLNNPFGIGLYRFALGNIDHQTPHNNGHDQNYTCTRWTPLELNTTYDITIRTGTANNEGARVYIDYNDNGIFEVDESVVSFPANTSGTRTLPFTTPASGVMKNKGLRLRVLSRFNAIPNSPCNLGDYGQSEDYTVYFPCQLLVHQLSGVGEGSLAAALTCASSGDTIRLSAALTGQTINVGSSPLLLNKNVVIQAEAPGISITGSGTAVFHVVSGTQVELSGMAIIAGTSMTAGAIYNPGMLKLTNVIIERNPGIMGATLLQNTTGAQLDISGNIFIQQ